MEINILNETLVVGFSFYMIICEDLWWSCNGFISRGRYTPSDIILCTNLHNIHDTQAESMALLLIMLL